MSTLWYCKYSVRAEGSVGVGGTRKRIKVWERLCVPYLQVYSLFRHCLRKIIIFSPYFRKQGLICAVPKLVVNQGVVGVLVSTIVWKAEGMGSFPIGAPNIMYPQILSYLSVMPCYLGQVIFLVSSWVLRVSWRPRWS